MWRRRGVAELISPGAGTHRGGAAGGPWEDRGGPAGFRLTPLSLTCDAHLPGTPQSEAGSSAAWLKLAAAFSAGPSEGSEARGGLEAPPPPSLQTKLYLVMKRRSGARRLLSDGRMWKKYK